MKINRLYLLMLAIVSGIVISFGWYSWASGLYTLVGFIPLLFIEEYLYQNRKQNKSVVFFFYSFVAFFTWNIINTWWIVNATFFGVSAAIIYSALLMSVTMWLFHISKRVLGSSLGYFCLVVFWLSFEHFYNFSELSWPWLNLGNAFANDIKIIQWYEFTGVYGGSLWALIINILLFIALQKYMREKKFRPIAYPLFVMVFLLVFPIVFSLITYYSYEEKGEPVEIVVLQPNIDPYNEKFEGMSNEKQLQVMLELMHKKITPGTRYILSPESAIEGGIWEHSIQQNTFLRKIARQLEPYPDAAFIAGIFSYKLYKTTQSKSPTSKPFRDDENMYYDRYNGVTQVDSTLSFPVYHKSKLVVGVEKMPFVENVKFLEKHIIQLGGIRSSLGYDTARIVFASPDGNIKTGTGICYESIFGEFMSKFVKNGANLLFIITNDGWWGDTPGYKQHQSYARLRAIETRRSIGRSANTGISSLINQRGDVLQQTDYWVRDVIFGKLKTNNKITLYTRHGDYISRIAHFFTVIMLLYTITMKTISRKK